MGLLPDTQNCGCACAGNAGNVFPVTAGKRSQHASRHVHYARAVMHAGIANKRFPLKSAAEGNVPGIPGACATCNFTYLVRGPWGLHWAYLEMTGPRCIGLMLAPGTSKLLSGLLLWTQNAWKLGKGKQNNLCSTNKASYSQPPIYHQSYPLDDLL